MLDPNIGLIDVTKTHFNVIRIFKVPLDIYYVHLTKLVGCLLR